TTLFTSDEPTCVRRIQTLAYEGEDPVEPPREFITMGPQGPHAVVVLREEINRQLRLINPPTQVQPASSASGSRTPMLITPEAPVPYNSSAGHLELLTPSVPAQPVPTT